LRPKANRPADAYRCDSDPEERRRNDRNAALATLCLRAGVFCVRPDVDALADAIRRVDALPRDRAAIRATAERFDRSVFLIRWRELLAREGFGGLVGR
jgi:glycosyltransferase involved in cell wall biosynthesis